MNKILFLYTELADYFINCLKELNSTGVEIYLVHWPVKKEAPFNFKIPKEITVLKREEFRKGEILELAEKIKPSIVVTSGWIDKEYVAVAKTFYGKIPSVCIIDNHWNGSFKQRLAGVMSHFTLKYTFSHIWVPGAPQKLYARKLGFREENILEGYYSGDTNYFNFIYRKFLPGKEKKYPKKFIYVGRYVKFKGIYDMWQAFTELQKEQPNEWELWCLGTGDNWGKRIIHPKIKHMGFVQPAELQKYLKKTGIFILPSHKEPWGVVVHEMAAAGFPLLCSNMIGAATTFLEEGKNGFYFNPGNKEEIKDKMKRIMRMPENELLEMGKYSHHLGQKITPEKWVNEISKLF